MARVIFFYHVFFYINMNELLEKIRQGNTLTSIFDYKGTELKYRALSSTEFDRARYKTLTMLTPKLTGFLLKIKLHVYDVRKVDWDKIPPKLFKSYYTFMKEVEYWIVYYSMKDYMPSDFSIDDVKKMNFVHDLAKKIYELSSASKKNLIIFCKSDEGSDIAKMVIDWNVPLISSIKDITPVQYKFMEIINGDKNYITEEELEKRNPVLMRMIRNVGKHNEN